MKQESFNLIHGSESCLILENENWFELKEIFNNAAKLHHLGIIKDLKNILKSLICNKERRLEWKNCKKFNESFEAIDEAILLSSVFFCFDEVTKIISNYKNETYQYGPLLEPIENSFVTSNIQKVLPLKQKRLSHIFELITTFKSVIKCLTIIYPKLYDIDISSNNEIEIYNILIEYVHSFQKERNLHIGNCNYKTVSKIFEEARLTQNRQSPFFKMAKINVSFINEMDFFDLSFFESTSEDPNEIIDNLTKNLFKNNSLHDLKIDWMKNVIKKENKKVNKQSNKLIQRVVDIENKITNMSEQIEQCSVDSNNAISIVSCASKKINEVYKYQQAIQEKHYELKEILNEEQKRTRTILFIAIAFLIIYRILLNK